MSDALLPCPFCGGVAEMASYSIEAAVRCTACGCRINRPHGAHDDNGLPEAIAAWNRRSPDTGMAEALRNTTQWLKAALDCKAWEWDWDQREVATADLASAEAALRALSQTGERG